MEFYETTLRGMKKILECFHEDFYAGIVEKCIEKWISDKDVMCMLGEFADSGKFRTFKFKPSDFSSDEQELDHLISLCGGFLFTGGHDVSPEIYGETPLTGLVDTCRKRDEMETLILRKAMAADKPILGICRGIQFINAALGGTLWQDLPSQHPSDVNHHQNLLN